MELIQINEWLMEAMDKLRNRKMKRLNLEPSFGSVIYTELGFGLMEHSGIYVSDGEIIDLSGTGNIRKVSFQEFTGHLTTVNHEIYVPCYDDLDSTISFPEAGQRALEIEGNFRNYNLILDNCHQFSAGCLTGDFENSNNFLWMLKDTAKRELGEDIVWKKWDWTRH